MEEQISRQRVEERIASYRNLSKLFLNRIPEVMPASATIYKHVDVGQIWGLRFTFWNVLLHDSDPQFKRLLLHLDSMVEKHGLEYCGDRLRNGLKNDPFSFDSELTAYDIFRSTGIEPEIDPPAASESAKKMDLSVNLDGRRILIEVITPQLPADMVKKGGGFAPLDMDLSKKLAGEIVHHFDVLSEPQSPTIIMVNGAYSGLDPVQIESSVDALNSLEQSDFPHENPEQSKLLANKGKLFVSAVLLFGSNWGSYMSLNPRGPNLTEKEVSLLTEIFQLPSKSTRNPES